MTVVSCRWCCATLCELPDDAPAGHLMAGPDFDHRCSGITVRRFYYADGTVKHVGMMNPPPSIWLVRDMPPQRMTVAHTYEPAIIEQRDRVFRRHDYGYPNDFIGPHRNADYHEDP